MCIIDINIKIKLNLLITIFFIILSLQQINISQMKKNEKRKNIKIGFIPRC
jgi:hypothetical protein